MRLRWIGADALRAATLTSLVALAACSTVPASGPTIGEINDSLADNNPLGLKVVEATPALVGMINRIAPETLAEPAFDRPVATGRLGTGDILSVTIFETGNGLFNGAASASTSGTSSSATATPMPPLQIAENGMVDVPYVGRIHAAGLTLGQLQAKVEGALKSKSMEPQVVIGLATNAANTVIVSGDVHAPGRYALSLQPERLLDMVALAGGPNNSIDDEVVELARGNKRFEIPGGDIETLGPRNPVLTGGDRVRLDFKPRTFMVFGSAGKVSEMPFTTSDVTLAQGLARAVATNDAQSDPEGVYLFRFERGAIAKELGLATMTERGAPVVYRFNLMDPTSYVLLKEFEMRDKDLVYVANARSLRVQKLFGVISNLFAPAAATRSIAQ